MEITNLGKADGLPPVDWAAVAEKLDAGSAPAPDALNSRTTWLSTVNEDGSPHVTAVGALWLDGTFWFQTGAGTRKGRNVARDPRCSIAVSIRDADVVIEGDAARVTEPGALARIAKAWADQGWPAEPDDSGPGITAPFNAPSQGPPPWNVYRIEPRSAIVTLADGAGRPDSLPVLTLLIGWVALICRDPRFGLSQISWRTRVAHHPTEDTSLASNTVVCPRCLASLDP